MNNQRGFTLLELMVSMSILSIVLAIVFTLTIEMWGWQKRLPVDFHKHPQIIAVISRMRRDVLDAYGSPTPYYASFEEYTDSDKVLILETLTEAGSKKVVWDFRQPGLAIRRAYQVGNYTEWKANVVPVEFTIITESGGTAHHDTIHLLATDKEGRLAIDQIFFPRTRP